MLTLEESKKYKNCWH